MPITEATIRDLAAADTYEKGEDYYCTNAISDIQKRGDIILARVEGSLSTPYHVAVTLRDDAIVTTSCTCPYHWGGICKHLVAVLLLFVRQPDRIEACTSLSELLTDINKAAAHSILGELLRQEPRLIERVEAMTRHKNLSTDELPPMVTSAPQPPAIVQPSSLRKQVQRILRDADFENPHAACELITECVLELLAYVHPFLKAKDGRNALLLLRAIIEPVLGCWSEHDHNAAVTNIFLEAGPLFELTMQHIDLSEIERVNWQKRLQKWQAELTQFGIPHVFDDALKRL